MFTVDQINSLLQTLNDQGLIFINKQLGEGYLTKDEIKRLNQLGINPKEFYKPENDSTLLNFHFGIISDAIGNLDSSKLTYKHLQDYLKSGQYIPLTQQEKLALDSIKKQSLTDIRANNNRIFNDINNIINSNNKNNRNAYEKVIRDEILLGVEKKKTVKEIASELNRKTGDWHRNFQKSVHYISHLAFDEGRAAYFERKYGNDVLVFKNVYPGACKYCINLYLKGGIGSEPKIFKLSTLKANGTNIGRKTSEWKPIIGPVHVYCRCTLEFVDPKKSWDKKLKRFELDKKLIDKETKKINRKPIRIKINGKEYSV